MKQQLKTLLDLYLLFSSIQSVLAIDFVFNGFLPSDILAHNGAGVLASGILFVPGSTLLSIPIAVYRTSKIVTKKTNLSLPFSTSFIFSRNIYLLRLGMVFFFVPNLEGTTSSYDDDISSLYNNAFMVEFNVSNVQEFNETYGNSHVEIHVDSHGHRFAHEAGYWNEESSFETLQLNDGRNYQVWIDYADFHINLTMAPVGMNRPKRALLDFPLNLSQVFQDDEMYVGFSAASSKKAISHGHQILSWSFSNSNFSIGDALITHGLPSVEVSNDKVDIPVYRSKGFIVGMTISVIFLVVMVTSLFLIKRNRTMKRERLEDNIEDWELEYWPHRISYRVIDAATKGFSNENVIGMGGNGKVYKGVLAGGSEVAVKCIHENIEGARQFLAEISSLGRLKHRNLVALRGWCKKGRGNLILVYHYMENGSLDKRLYERDVRNYTLSFGDRIKILKDVASGVLYLHEEWEAKVLHRDIKASNVLLDKEMNARIGDFGLARMHDHGQVANVTQVVGTVGYLAPEFAKTGRASTQTDVFSYGVLMLEVMCGRRPIEEGKPPLVDWLWELMKRGELGNTFDNQLRTDQGFNEEEALRVLKLGMICASLDPKGRPTMRQVVKFFEKNCEVDENEDEDIDVYLRSNTMFSNYRSSVTFSSTNSLLEGR